VRPLMKLFPRIISLLIVAILICSFISVYGEKVTQEVCFKNVCVHCEIADSGNKRAKGLMFRKELAKDRGMLFIFDKETMPSFWMKNVEFPLDIIWINQDKKIIGINTNVPLCKDYCESIMPPDKIRYVLEVNAGFVDKNQVKIGERVNFR